MESSNRMLSIAQIGFGIAAGVFALYALITGMGLHPATEVWAQTGTSSTPLVVQLEKKFSGTDEGFEPEQFSFRVTGGGVDEIVPHDGTIELEPGTYSIEEIGPSGFDLDDWTIQWSGGGGCENVTADTGTIIVEEGDGEHYGQIRCTADNQFKPDDDDGNGNGGGNGTTTPGTLTIVKVVINDDGGTAMPEDFSFSIKDTNNVEVEAGAFGSGTATTSTTTLSLAAGTYTVTESDPGEYDVSYNGCSDIALLASGSATCTITNDDEDDHGGGGGGQRYTLTVTITTETEDGEEASGTVTGDGIDCSSERTEEDETQDCEETYDAGTVVELTATPGADSTFSESWTVGADNCTGNATPCTITMDQDHDVTAHFSISTSNGGGSNNPPGTSRGGGSSRIGNPSSEPVIAAQVEIIPAGAANAGAGGSQSDTSAALLLLLLSSLGAAIGFALVSLPKRL